MLGSVKGRYDHPTDGTLRLRLPNSDVGERRAPLPALHGHFLFTTTQNLGLLLSPGERAMLEVILQNAGGQGWADRAFLSFHGAHDFSTADDFRL